MTSKAILFVDDEKTILDSLKAQVKNMFGKKYVYEMAESADEAWEIILELEKSGVETLVIVSDWLMPGIKGDEFLIKVHGQFPKIVKVMLTGHADEKAVENAKSNANLHRCIMKPWNKEELYDAILSGLE